MIPCSNPRAQYLAHREAIDRAIASVLERGRYVLGEEVTAFEREFATFIGTKHAVSVASGTDALVLALKGAGIAPGDEVITTAHTAVATVAAIELAGARPVLADIDPATFTLDPARVEPLLGPRVRAIVAVHLYGQAADLDALAALARDRGLVLIEDSAQAHGAMLRGRRLGSVGRAGCFSFYPTKNLGALGDGGLLSTDDAELAARCRALREYGWNTQRESTVPGMNSRLDELQAAVLRVKLGALDADNQRRARIAERYDRGLAGGPWRLPVRRAEGTHVFHQYVVRSENRDRLLDHLRQSQVGAMIHYPVPAHLQAAYRGRLRGSDALPETERAAREVLSLPMYPELEPADADRVIEAMQAYARRPS